jgi:hypothetical protein
MLSSPVYVNTELRSAKLQPRQPISPARLSSFSFCPSQPFNLLTFKPCNDLRSNSFPHTSLAAPHPLTPIESHPYKNHRGALLLACSERLGEGSHSSLPQSHQTPAHHVFSVTYKLPIFYPLCFDIHPCNGGVGRGSPVESLKNYFNFSEDSPRIVRQSQNFSSFAFTQLQTLSFSVSSKPCICHSYENTGGVGRFFPIWNTEIGWNAQAASSTIAHVRSLWALSLKENVR